MQDTLLVGDILDKVSNNLASGSVIGWGAWTEPESRGIDYFIFKYGINYLLALRNVTVGPFLYCDREAFFRVAGFDESYYAVEEFTLAKQLKKEGNKENKCWKMIKHHPDHRIITSSRRFGGLEMGFKNIHLLWKLDRKLRQKDQCKFWYEDR